MPPAEIFATAMEMSIATLMLLFAGFLVFGSGARTSAAYALAALTAMVGLSLVFSLLGSTEPFEYLRRLRPPLALLMGPALLIYVSQVAANSAPLQRSALLHFTPAVGGVVLMLSPYALYTDLFLNICIGTYWLMSATTCYRHRDDYSLQTVRRFVFGLVTIFGIVVLLDVVLSVQAQALGVYRNLPAYLVGLLSILAGAAKMMWTALQYPQLLAAPDLFIKYAKSGLDDAAMQVLGDRLDALMSNDRVFLEEDLSLANVAERLGAQPRHVSQVVNSRFGTNFSAYVNERRVREAARQLQMSGKTVTQVMYDVGFNSKSSFNREFRRHFEMSPKAWRGSTNDRQSADTK